MPELVITVTGNHTASVIRKTLAQKLVGKTTIAIGIQAVAGIGQTHCSGPPQAGASRPTASDSGAERAPTPGGPARDDLCTGTPGTRIHPCVDGDVSRHAPASAGNGTTRFLSSSHADNRHAADLRTRGHPKRHRAQGGVGTAARPSLPPAWRAD